ncbi:hypothetical protein KY285_000229 [Solanum tuberosum]|nr:hypothetical protein KY285_000229 [Solanum tuberosum]
MAAYTAVISLLQALEQLQQRHPELVQDLEHWEAISDNFPNLKRLVLKKCNYLNEIPTDFGEICTFESIELYHCSIGAEESARKIEQEQEDMGNNCL